MGSEAAEPTEAEQVQTERIAGQDNEVVVGWINRLGFIQLGVQIPEAIPGGEDGHFTTLSIEAAEQVVKMLRQAIRAAGRAY